MRYNLKLEKEKPKAEKECRHYWVIESSGGPTSKGVCKFCGAAKEFSNRFPDSRPEGDKSFLREFVRDRDDEPDGETKDADFTSEHGVESNVN